MIGDRLGVVDAGGELVRGEAAEHDGMDGADPRAGQHRDDRLRHHRHVDDDAVALARRRRSCSTAPSVATSSRSSA